FDPQDAWDELSDAHKAQWEALGKQGWRLVSKADDDGTVRATRADFHTNDDIWLDVYRSAFKKMEESGRRLAWIHDAWAVDFDRKLVYIDAWRDSSAAEYVRQVLDVLAGPDAGLQGYDKTSAAYLLAHPEAVGVHPADRDNVIPYAQVLNRAK